MEIVIQSLYSFHFLSDEPPFVAWAGIINTKKADLGLKQQEGRFRAQTTRGPI